MREEMKDIAINRLTNASIEILRLYNDIALLLNACDIAKKRYQNLNENIHINTTQNIPNEYRLNLEIDVTFNKNQLISSYSEKLIETLCLDYLIRIVSILDACFEDIYESLLPLLDTSLSSENASRLVRKAWSNDNLRKFFIEELNLKKPHNKISTPSMVFDRYEEIRQIRHSIIHNKGILSEKHKNKLKELSEKLPLELKKGSLTNADFIKTGRVEIFIGELYSLRKWSYETIYYFIEVFKIS